MATLFFLILLGLFTALGVWVRRQLRRSAWRTAALVLLVLLGLPGLYVLAGFSAAAANNLRLSRFASQLKRYPLPEGARVISESRAVGVLTGNGDHCDFVATRRIHSSLSLEQIEAHYAKLDIQPAISGGAGAGLPILEVERERSGTPQTFHIKIVDAPYEGILDPRCH